MYYKKSIFNRLFNSYVLIGIIPILILSISYYWFFTSVFTDTITKQTYANTEAITNNIDSLIQEYKEIINTLSKEPAIHNAIIHGSINSDIQQEISIKSYLSLASKHNKASLYIVDTKGNTVFSTHPLPNHYDVKKHSNWGIFRKANNSYDAVTDANKYTHPSGDTVAIGVIKAIRDQGGTPKGYIIIDIYRKHIVDIYNNVDSSLATDTIVIDQRFYTIVDVRKPYLEATLYKSNDKDYIYQKKSGFYKEQVNGSQSLVTFVNSDKSDIIVIAVTPMDIIIQNQKFIKKIAMVVAGISIFICFIFAFLIAQSISKPIRKLVKSMKKVKDGDLSINVEENREDELGMLARSFNTMIMRIQDLLDNIVEKQQRVRVAEIKALQAQINPHFLYNTLDSIKWIAKMNNVEEISIIATHLAKLLRNTINSGEEIVTVEESIKVIKSYLLIQKIRYSEKFDILIDIEDQIMQYKVPKLIFQPIVENATIHGLESKVGHGILSIKGIKQEEHMIFTISDNGVGMDQEYVEAIQKGEYSHLQKSDSIGIQNVDRRIKLYYGIEYGLQVESSPEKGTTIIFKIPIITGGELND